jgi:hypothetical protein
MSLDEWRFADRTLKGAVYLTGVTCVIICVAYLSPYWLQSVPSEKLPSPKFTNLGSLGSTRIHFVAGCSASMMFSGLWSFSDYRCYSTIYSGDYRSED